MRACDWSKSRHMSYTNIRSYWRWGDYWKLFPQSLKYFPRPKDKLEVRRVFTRYLSNIPIKIWHVHRVVSMSFILTVFTARCTIVRLSVCLSVCPSFCDVGGSGPHRLEILEKQKPIKNFGEKGEWAYPETAQIFGVPPVSGMGKATNFKFCTHIQRIDRS